jgi:hypothetical protein
MLRFNDRRSIQKYNSTAPVQWDMYGDYNDCSGAVNSPFANFSDAADYDIVQRGAWKLLDLTATYGVAPNIGGIDTSFGDVAWVAGTNIVYTLKFKTFEPLLCPPFSFCDPDFNKGAMYGISNMNFTFNFGNMNRVLRFSRNTGVAPNTGVNATNVNLVSVDKANLHFFFLTGQPSDMLPARNVHPYIDMPRYITQNLILNL